MKSTNDASDTNEPYSRAPGCSAPRGETVQQACSKASGERADHKPGKQTGGEGAVAAQTAACGSTGADAVQVVQAGMGGDCRPRAECDGNTVRLPVLPEIASCSWSGTGI